ncbi:MAG TPA: hypothetical protein VMZ00_07310 [Sporichthya sp.]|nr:hypothetical protein [Sporichthya sp.]
MSSISLGETRTGATRVARAPRAPHDGPEPWARADVVGVAIVLALAGIGLVLGWLGVSDTVDLNDQTRWLGFGICALIVGGFGMVGWLLRGLVRVATLRRQVLAELDRRRPQPVSAGAAPPLTERQELGTAAGMRRYHRAECQMLAGKDVTFAAAAAHADAGLAPCPICLSTPGGKGGGA